MLGFSAHSPCDGSFWMHYRRKWVGGEVVQALAYDVPIPGYKTKNTINLHLWEAKAGAEDFNLFQFNDGQYESAAQLHFRAQQVGFSLLYKGEWASLFGQRTQFMTYYHGPLHSCCPKCHSLLSKPLLSFYSRAVNNCPGKLWFWSSFWAVIVKYKIIEGKINMSWIKPATFFFLIINSQTTCNCNCWKVASVLICVSIVFVWYSDLEMCLCKFVLFFILGMPQKMESFCDWSNNFSCAVHHFRLAAFSILYLFRSPILL